MHLRFILLTACVALMVSSARAEFFVELYDFSQPIATACTGGTPVPDGAVVKIYWDSLGNGADDNDPQPPEGSGFMQVNYNQFLLNGNSIIQTPGGFYVEENFVMADGYPDPSQGTGNPIYFLKVCVPEGVIWTSDTFRVVQGYQTKGFGVDAGEELFTCVPGICQECPSPAVVTNLTGSQAYCDSIVLDWDHDGVNCAGYRVLLADEFPQQFVYVPGAANTRFVHTDQAGGIDVNYGVRAYNVCGTGQDADTVYSTRINVTGRAVVAPPTPTNVVATDNLCGTVHVTWSINTVLGLDEFHIFRNGTMIGTAPHGSAGDDHQYVDNSPPATAAEYCVFGFSNVCGLGNEDCDQGQAGSAPTGCTVTNVVASDDDCDSVCVTWTANCPDVTEYQVLRSTILVGTVTAAGGPNYSFCHAAPAGLAGGYQIRPINACGNGNAQPTPPESGVRLAPPGNIAGIQASDTLCDKVTVVWTDNAAAAQYEVRRNPGGTLATVNGDINTYDDLTAVAGTTYNYTVVGLNACGTGSVATGNGGTRRAGGTGTALFTLVTAGPPNWTYSMDVTSGCLDRVKIRDYCDGTTATAPAGWTATVYGLDSIIFATTTSVGALDPVVTGFVLSHPTCDGDGRWNVGQSGGSIRGPLPVGDNAALPTEYSVNVFPNPFNPMTNFRIAIPQASDTRILVFNIAGQLVREMAMGRMQAGYHTVQFGGSDLPSGMYFARVQSGNFNSTHKLMLLK